MKPIVVKSAVAIASYIAFVTLVVFIEVRLQKPELGKWSFYTGSTVFVLTIFWLHLQAKSKGVASVIALVLVLFSLLVAVVVGTNFKFWLGGTV